MRHALRVHDELASEVLRAGELEVRPRDFLVLARGKVLMVSKREQQVLAVLMRREGRIVSREELYALVWGKMLRPRDRSVDVYVRKLRVKLEEALPEWNFIHTHFGFGYRFSCEPVVRETLRSRVSNN